MIALFNTDEMRFEWEKMSEIPKGLEIKPRLLFTEMALTSAMRQGQEKETLQCRGAIITVVT